MGSHPLSGLSRLIRIPRSFRELSSRDLLSSRFAPSLAVKPSGNIRQLRPKLPSAGRVIAAYAFSLVLLPVVLPPVKWVCE